jgi:putative endonuclease
MTARQDEWQTYLLHFDEPIGDVTNPVGYAQHYTGSTPDLERRLAEHRTRSDVKLMKAVRRAGITWTLARTWPGGRARERQIKKQGGARRHCPVCKAQPPLIAAAPQAEAGIAPRFIPQPREAAARAADAEPLWESVAARLDPAEAAVFVAELAAAEQAAWTAAKVGAPDYEARFDEACELSRLRAAEASAVQRLAEERAVAEADGWLAGPEGAGLDLEAGQ